MPLKSNCTITIVQLDSYRHLGIYLIDSDVVYKKRMSRLYFLKKLTSFTVCSKMLEIFYQSVVSNAICFVAVCWWGEALVSEMPTGSTN